MTSDIQNQLQQIQSGKECSGDLRGLAGHLQMAAEAPEGYLRGWRDPPEDCGV